MRKRLTAVLCLALPWTAGICQSVLTEVRPDTADGLLQAIPSSAAKVPSEVVVPQDMRVKLRLAEGLSTATDHKGYIVHLEVASDVVADGVVVVPAGTRATARITYSDSNRLAFSIPTLMVNGKRVRLSEQSATEWGGGGADAGVAIAMVVVTSPILAVQLPISAVYGIVDHVRDRRKAVDTKRVILREPGTIYTYYTRKTRLRLRASTH